MHGLKFQEVLSEKSIREIFEKHLCIDSRERFFSITTTFWTFLSQVLDPDHSCRAAVARYIAGLEFFKKSGTINEKKVAIDEKYDGMSFLFTTTRLSDSAAIFTYFDKDVVEKCFQSLKDVVNLRPIRLYIHRLNILYGRIDYLQEFEFHEIHIRSYYCFDAVLLQYCRIVTVMNEVAFCKRSIFAYFEYCVDMTFLFAKDLTKWLIQIRF